MKKKPQYSIIQLSVCNISRVMGGNYERNTNATFE
jgi:hypothetical protein